MGNVINLGQDSLVFRPPTIPLDIAEDISFTIDGQIAFATFSPPGDSGAGDIGPEKILIYSLGNGCDIAMTRDLGHTLAAISGATVILYDYPGYGYTCRRDLDASADLSLSRARVPSEAGCVEALEQVVKHCQWAYPNKKVVLVGWSLGSGVTAQYAYRANWTQPIMLVSPFKSICRVAESHLPPSSHWILTSVVSSIMTSAEWCAQNMFATHWYVSRLRCPVKLVHGTHDTLIPIEHSHTLYGLLKYPMTPVWKQAQGHVVTHGREDFVGL